jgi:hypothetical protein
LGRQQQCHPGAGQAAEHQSGHDRPGGVGFFVLQIPGLCFSFYFSLLDGR